MSLLSNIRIDVGDAGSSGNYRFSDAQIIEIIEKSVRRINRRLHLTNTPSQIYSDASGNLTPNDPDLHDMVLLQAECMILNVDANYDFTSSSTGAGFFVRDGEQSYDNRGESANRANARSNYMKTPYNPCAELEKAIKDEELNRSFGNGKLIW